MPPSSTPKFLYVVGDVAVQNAVITLFTQYGPALCDKKYCSEYQTLFHFRGGYPFTTMDHVPLQIYILSMFHSRDGENLLYLWYNYVRIQE